MLFTKLDLLPQRGCREGKIKYIGLSDCTPNTIRRAHKIHPVSAVQRVELV